MTNKILGSFALPSVLLALASCLPGCNAATAQSPRLVDGGVSRDSNGNPVDTGAREFAPADITFKYSQLFMWKKDSSADDIATVLNNSTLYEDTQDQGYLLNQTAKPIMARFKAIGVDLSSYDPDQYSKQLPAMQKELSDKQAQLAQDQTQLDTLKAQPASDDVSKKIADLNKAMTTLTKRIKFLNDQTAPLIQTQTAIKNAHLEADLATWVGTDSQPGLSGQLTQIRAQANSYLVPINAAVWIFNSSPIGFTFTFDAAGQVHASIHNWDLSIAQMYDPEIAEEGVDTEFSTEITRQGKPTMGKVTYETMGGVYTFEAYTPKATYWFKIARTKYEAVDGRIHYKGDIVRCSVADGSGDGLPVIVHVRDFVQCGVEAGSGTPELRRGAANLVDLDDNS